MVKYGPRGANNKQCYRCKNEKCTHQPTNLEFRDDHFDIYIARILYLKYTRIKPKPLLTLNKIANLLGQYFQTIENWAIYMKIPEVKPKQADFIKYVENRENGSIVLDLLGRNGKDAMNETLARLNARKPRTRNPMVQIRKEKEQAERLERQEIKQKLKIKAHEDLESRVGKFCRLIMLYDLEYIIKDRKDFLCVNDNGGLFYPDEIKDHLRNFCKRLNIAVFEFSNFNYFSLPNRLRRRDN